MAMGEQIGLVLMQKVVYGLTQAVHLNWNFKIGPQARRLQEGVADRHPLLYNQIS